MDLIYYVLGIITAFGISIFLLKNYTQKEEKEQEERIKKEKEEQERIQKEERIQKAEERINICEETNILITDYNLEYFYDINFPGNLLIRFINKLDKIINAIQFEIIIIDDFNNILLKEDITVHGDFIKDIEYTKIKDIMVDYNIRNNIKNSKFFALGVELYTLNNKNIILNVKKYN